MVGRQRGQLDPGFWRVYAGLGVVGAIVGIVGLATGSFGWLAPFFGVVGAYYLVRAYIGYRAGRHADER
jgi:hypothetical protein